ncbi:GDP dissociation inhibitor [Xylariaceae sp. FL0016]|nr:GDP dissociation inhibitor [Xylariaceae sp. FL0016]
MESLDDKTWDTVICGTGLQQSLLALALSRSDKRILHLDKNDYYGEHEAALSLQEAESFAKAYARDRDAQQLSEGAMETQRTAIFRNASVWKNSNAEAKGLSLSRAYSLALAPQIIHTRSQLLSQLVTSRAYRQVEFLAVGSFFVYDASASEPNAKLARIPSSREDVFSTKAIPVRAKRSLMKFLKFVMDYDSEEQKLVWQDHGESLLTEFLSSQFGLDESLRQYILALTLTLDGKVKVREGLASIHRHLASIGLFGPGFCAVYPKWGGLSEIAQVACRAQAVGGGIYMLDHGYEVDVSNEDPEIALKLSSGITVRTNHLISAQQDVEPGSRMITRLVAIVNAPLKHVFEATVEGAPNPAVAIIAFPSGAFSGSDSTTPVYAFVHHSDTGECPTGQSVIYLTTLSSSGAPQRLEKALDALLQMSMTLAPQAPSCLFKLLYEQYAGKCSSSPNKSTSMFEFPAPSFGLAFDDSCLDAVKDAWNHVTGDSTNDDQYMIFQDRESVGDDDDEVFE